MSSVQPIPKEIESLVGIQIRNNTNNIANIQKGHTMFYKNHLFALLSIIIDKSILPRSYANGPQDVPLRNYF